MEVVGVFMAVLSTLRPNDVYFLPVGTFCGHLVHFSPFGMSCREKSGNPVDFQRTAYAGPTLNTGLQRSVSYNMFCTWLRGSVAGCEAGMPDGIILVYLWHLHEQFSHFGMCAPRKIWQPWYVRCLPNLGPNN
jgi:hypothetical protein